MIRSRQDNQYLSYILDDNSSFSLTAYRVLKKQEKGLIPCHRLLYNGCIKLLYPIDHTTSLSLAAGFWQAGEVRSCIGQVLKILMEIRENGFLQMETVDTDASHMFFDQSSNQVQLIALPVLQEGGDHGRTWEWNLRRSMISLIELSRASENQVLEELKKELANPRISLNNLYCKLTGIKPADTERLNKESGRLSTGPSSARLRLTLKNHDRFMQFTIDQPEFVLGKNGAVVDGLLDRAPTVSRTHCKICKMEDGFYVEDLKSKNFTFLNGERLEPGVRTHVKSGDRLRLAEYEFEVEDICG